MVHHGNTELNVDIDITFLMFYKNEQCLAIITLGSAKLLKIYIHLSHYEKKDTVVMNSVWEFKGVSM